MAFEFIPKKKVELNLEETAKTLRKNFEVQIETPVFLAIRIENTNVSLFKSGKITVKETREKEKARQIAEKIVKEI